MYSPKPLGIAALLLTGLALTACGSSGNKASSDSSLTPTPSSSSAGSSAGAPSSQPTAAKNPTVCGKIQMKGNEESVVRVKGTTPCDALMTFINAYDKAAKGPNGEAAIKGWKCQTATPAETQKDGYITTCIRSSEEFVTKLH
jgi:hypothetical protein